MSNQQGNRKRALPWKERRSRCLSLRRGGATFAQIAEELGFSIARAHQICKAELEKLAEQTMSDAVAIRELEVQRLDRLLFRLWPRTEQGDLEAMRVALRIAERRARLLGLDAPEALELFDRSPRAEGELVSISIGGERVAEMLELEEADPESFRGRVPNLNGSTNGEAPSSNGGPSGNGHP